MSGLAPMATLLIDFGVRSCARKGGRERCTARKGPGPCAVLECHGTGAGLAGVGAARIIDQAVVVVMQRSAPDLAVVADPSDAMAAAAKDFAVGRDGNVFQAPRRRRVPAAAPLQSMVAV